MVLFMAIQLDELPATFTLLEVIAAGGSRRAVYSWRDSGKVVQISRGVYRKADAAETAYLDVLAAAMRAPRGVVCLVSALALHELTDDIPPAVQLAVPRVSIRRVSPIRRRRCTASILPLLTSANSPSK
ncbi:hypothetical protein GCM10029992_24930 [Glycomyces albus]